jgi:hypothetical protein
VSFAIGNKIGDMEYWMPRLKRGMTAQSRLFESAEFVA